MEVKRSINLKVLLKDPTDSTYEVRRFEANILDATNFVHLQEKIRTIFPALNGSNFKLTWKDTDGDDISISSNEELITAFEEMNGNVKTLYIGAAQPKTLHDEQQKEQASASNSQSMGDERPFEAIARQFLPLLPGMGAPSNSTGACNKPREAALVDMLQNLAEHFLGKLSHYLSPTDTYICSKVAENTSTEQGQGCSSNSSQTDPKDLKMAEGLAQLEEMGFRNDDGYLSRLLHFFGGDVSKVVIAMSET